jgi:hypothetical protein
MRRMIWVKPVRGWGCSECSWAFIDAGPPQGDTISEMAENFERLRDKEFASHMCTRYPKPKNEGTKNQ